MTERQMKKALVRFYRLYDRLGDVVIEAERSGLMPQKDVPYDDCTYGQLVLVKEKFEKHTLRRIAEITRQAAAIEGAKR